MLFHVDNGMPWNRVGDVRSKQHLTKHNIMLTEREKLVKKAIEQESFLKDFKKLKGTGLFLWSQEDEDNIAQELSVLWQVIRQTPETKADIEHRARIVADF